MRESKNMSLFTTVLIAAVTAVLTTIATCWLLLPRVVAGANVSAETLRIGSPGGPCIVLDSQSKNEVGLRILDGDGKVRTRIRAGAVELMNVQGKPQCSIYLSSKDEPVIQVTSGNGQRQAALTSENDHCGLTILNKEAPELTLMARDEGNGICSYQSGKLAAALSSAKDQRALLLFDSDERTRVVVGNASLENHTTGSTTTTGLSSIALFDKTGKVLAKLPLWEP